MSELKFDASESQHYGIEPEGNKAFSSFDFNGLKHNYHEHPLFQLDSLKALSKYLFSRKQCRFIQPGMKLDSEFMHYDSPSDGRSIDELFDGLDQTGSWMALYNIEAHPEYAKLLNKIMDDMAPLYKREQGQHFNVGGFIFISAPPSITPFHIDRENNFWLQIKGRKRISLFDRLDREVIDGETVDRFIVDRSLEEVKLDDKKLAHAQHFDMVEGNGVYFPSTTPHMTETEQSWADEGYPISISIGIVFYTDWTRKFAQICQSNLILRKFGISPKYPAVNTLSGNMKAVLGKLFALYKKKFRGYSPPPGSY